jgi:hypothetical protein
MNDWTRGTRRVGDKTPTLEGINIEALVVPVELLFLKCVLNFASLGIVWGDDPVGFAFILEILSKKHDCFDLFLVLKVASRHVFSVLVSIDSETSVTTHK